MEAELGRKGSSSPTIAKPLAGPRGQPPAIFICRLNKKGNGELRRWHRGCQSGVPESRPRRVWKKARQAEELEETKEGGNRQATESVEDKAVSCVGVSVSW